MPAQRILDQVQSLAAADALAADPGAFASALAAELPGNTSHADVTARDAAIAAALAQIDALAVRVMRLRLDHALATDVASDAAIAQPTRRVFAQTIASYDGRLALLADRARDVAARGGAREPDRAADLVIAAAGATLDLRAALRDRVLALRRDLEEPEPPPEPTLADLIEID